MDSAYKLAIEIVADARNFEVTMNRAGGAVDETTGKIRNATDGNSDLTESFGGIGAGITKFMAIAGAAAGVIVFLKEAIGSTEGGADKLEETTAALKGTWEGLNQTISAGNWDQLIQNIVNTSKASRDAAISADELENVLASNTIRKGFAERERDSAKMAAIESRNAADKQRYIAEAITAQKALSSIVIDELEKTLNATEGYYQSRMNWTKEEAEYNFSKIREMAGNYETFFGEGSIAAEAMQERIRQLKYLQSAQVGGLKLTDQEELNRLQSTVRTMGIFKTLMDDVSKPGQFNEYVKGVGAINSANAQALEDLFRLQKQFESTDKALEKLIGNIKELKEAYGQGFSVFSGGDAPAVPSVKAPTVKDSLKASDAEKLRPSNIAHSMALETTKRESEELLKQKVIAKELSGVFEDMFMNIDGGFEAMAESVINFLKKIAAEIAAQAAVFALMALLFPEGALVKKGLGAFMSGIIPGLASGGIASGPTLAMVGEYPGAKNNPEVIAPLSDLKGILGTQQAVPQRMRLALDGQGSLYAYLEYRNRRINNYR